MCGLTTWPSSIWMNSILQDISAGGLPPCRSDLEGEGWSIYLNKTKLTEDPSMAIQNFTLGRQYGKYLADKGLLTLVAFDLVDWQATGKGSR